MFLKIKPHDTIASEFRSNNTSNYYFNDVRFFSREDTIIGNFKKINFFVGSNNSGKSRFLRGLFKTDESFLHISISEIIFESILLRIDNIFTEINKELHYVTAGFQKGFKKISGTYYNLINNGNNDVYFDLINNYHSKVNGFDEIKSYKQQLDIGFGYTTHTKENVNHYDNVSNFISCIDELNEYVLYAIANQPRHRIYIPTLRSLTRNSNFASETFNVVIKENYAIDKNVFTGLELYDDIRKKKLSASYNRRKVKEFEKFLSKTFFDNKDVEITSNADIPATILFSIDDVEYPIFDIGDGLQMLIILLFPIFTAENNTWVFIEEPETHLHPGLQRIFIEALLNDEYLKSKNLFYFFTSHSNHFLDLSINTDEISIFQFEKEQQDKFVIKNIKPRQEILELLGVNTSSVFLANSSVWVEGPTDRKYISKLLKLYCEDKKINPLIEDIDFAFFEYGGNLIEHYLFDDNFDENSEDEVREKINSFALSNKIYLLADNDNAKGKKLERRKKLEEFSIGKNFKYQNTEYFEIENLLPLKVIRDFLPELINSGSEKLEKIDFKRQDYINIGIGEFIKRQFDKIEITDIKSFKSTTGETLTTAYKNKLCDFVITSNYTFSELSEDNDKLKSIVEELYQFIKT